MNLRVLTSAMKTTELLKVSCLAIFFGMKLSRLGCKRSQKRGAFAAVLPWGRVFSDIRGRRPLNPQ